MGQEKGETLRSNTIFLAGRAVTGRRGHDVRVSGIGATDGAYAAFPSTDAKVYPAC